MACHSVHCLGFRRARPEQRPCEGPRRKLLGTLTPSRRRQWQPLFASWASLAHLQDQDDRQRAPLARSTVAATRLVGSLLRELRMRAFHQEATPKRCMRRSG